MPNLRPLTSKLAQRWTCKNWALPLHKVKNKSCQNSMKLSIQVHIGSRTSHKKFELHSSTRMPAPVDLLPATPSPKLSRPALPRALTYGAQIFCVMFYYQYVLGYRVSLNSDNFHF